jgi:hypothetical protein
MPSLPIYRADPNQRADSDFSPGVLRYLVVGNRGRLLDERRTPVEITGIDVARGFFEVEVQAFEDEGARWYVPFEDVDRHQFVSGSRVASAAMVDELEDGVRKFDRPMTIEIEPETRERTLEKLRRDKSVASRWLDAQQVAERLDLEPHVEKRRGEPRLCALARAYLRQQRLEQMDSDFARTYVSNPASGELVKGHAIVLAELGLCPYRGKVVRDPRLFEAEWSKGRRAEHILRRLAFAQALWSRARLPVSLYRGFSSEESPDPRPASFVSATFSRAVAEAHHPSSVRKQDLPLDRIFMSFLETEAMNFPYREAEAVLIGDERAVSF